MEKISINKNFILGKNKFAIRNFSFAIIFVFVALFGLFGMAGKASAQVVNGKCVSTSTYTPVFSMENISLAACQGQLKIANTGGTWTPNNPPGGDPVQIASPTTQAATQKPPEQKSDFEKMLEGKGCASLTSFDMGACVLKFLFYGIQMPLSGILWVAAKFFDYLIYFTLSTALFKESFVVEAWGVVRDLSNIFFILILLYAAFETILGIAHNAEKIIKDVIIVALLINFSMFLTGVVIDSANVLALIFYNKIDVKYIDGSGNPKDRPDTPVGGEKGISGSMANNFNLTKLVTGEMFVKAKSATNTVPGSNEKVSDGEAPTSLMIVIVLIAIVIMGVASYAFIVTGLSFLGRMIELFVLIIFSPFAFMSSTVPKLAGTEYLGWDPWFKRLINVSFMAPIFMFFLYFIFLLMKGPLIKQAGSSANSDSFISMILGMVLPTLFIVSLLLKAVEFAKKGSGKFGEMVSTGAKVVGGLALGAATGGAALALTNTIGARAQRIASDDDLKAQASGDKEHFARMGITDVNVQRKMQAEAQKKLAKANKYANKSFDIRDTGIGKFAAKQSGMDFSKGTGVLGIGTDKLKGGKVEQIKRKTEEEQAKQKTYEMSGDAAVKQKERVNEYEADKEKVKQALEEKNKNEKKEYEERYTKELKIKRSEDPGWNDQKEKKFREEYEAKFSTPTTTFNEKDFKKAYEAGDVDRLKYYGIDKEKEHDEKDHNRAKEVAKMSEGAKFNEAVFEKQYNERIKEKEEEAEKIKNKEMEKAQKKEGDKFDKTKFEEEYKKKTEREKFGGSVDKVETINADRRTAYANSLVDKAELEKARGALKTFWGEFREDINKFGKTKAAVALGLGIATGGAAAIAIPAAIAALSGLKAFKAVVGHKVFGDIKSTNAEVIAGVRKGEDPNKSLIKELKKLRENDHAGFSKVATAIKEKVNPPASEGAEHATPPSNH